MSNDLPFTGTRQVDSVPSIRIVARHFPRTWKKGFGIAFPVAEVGALKTSLLQSGNSGSQRPQTIRAQADVNAHTSRSRSGDDRLKSKHGRFLRGGKTRTTKRSASKIMARSAQLMRQRNCSRCFTDILIWQKNFLS